MAVAHDISGRLLHSLQSGLLAHYPVVLKYGFLVEA